MKIKFIEERKTEADSEFLIAGIFKDTGIAGLPDFTGVFPGGAVSAVAGEKGFFKNPFETRVIYSGESDSCRRVLLVSLGDAKSFSLDKLRKASGITAVLAEKTGVSSVTSLLFFQAAALKPDWKSYDIASAITDGVCNALYSFDIYKSEKSVSRGSVREFVFAISGKKTEAARGAKDALTVAGAVATARDLVNHPGNTATPSYLAKEAGRVALEAGIKCRVLSEKQAEKLGMGAFLGVARGSSEPPRFIILEYSGGAKSDRPFVIVGKGLTFDSGGISLKPSEKMEEMKFDMAGGAAAIGAVQAIASLKLKVNVVSLIPATENMPGGRANKPGDILMSMSGQTIEVINTDAEGRLILSDALCYAKRYKPRAVIDLATLTGACIVALGHHATAVLGNDSGLVADLVKAGDRSGERLWEMPLWEEFDEQLKSTIADMKNTGGRAGGTITAAAFLKKFASDYRWAHLDIAGTAWQDDKKPWSPSGATGVGVRLLVEYIKGQI